MSDPIYLIYKHTSPSGKSYIGLTNDYDRRCKEHQKYTWCRALYTAIQKHGWDNFTHEILIEHLTLEEANALEEFYISDHNTFYPSGYNLTTGGKVCMISEETKAKMSAANKGKKLSDEHKAKMSIAQTGRTHSEESKIKIGNASRGRIHNEESRSKNSAAQKGKILSKETRYKMATSRLGKKFPRAIKIKASD